MRKMRGVLPAIGFVILVWAIWGQPRQDTLLRVYGGLGQPAEKALVAAGFECRQEGPILTVRVEDREKCLRVLLQSLTGKTVEESVILENIRNQNARPDWEGNVYRRKFMVYDRDGRLEGWHEDPSDYNWVYQPSDTDAVKSGPKAGYLPKPNINLPVEEANLSRVRLDKERIKQSIRQLDPELVVGDVNVSWSDYPRFSLTDGEGPILNKSSETQAKLDDMSHFDLDSIKGLNKLPASKSVEQVVPLVQSTADSAGQACVAMCLNALAGSSFTDMDIDRLYGFQILYALKNESATAGYTWRDAGNLVTESWNLIDTKVNREGLPVIVALNGPVFSPSGQGHIMTIVRTTSDTVTYADPADGKLRTTEKQNMIDAPTHPDGNFIFVAERIPPDQL